jgi:colicin import membrane protein
MRILSRHPQDEFKKMIIVSGIVHAALVLVFTVKMFLSPSEAIDYSAAIKVDLVALPDKEKENHAPSKPPPEKATPVEEPKHKTDPAPKVALNKTKEKKLDTKAALRKLKEMEAIENLEHQEKVETATKAKAQERKGNIISPGTSLKGLGRIQFESYITTLDRHIKEHWSLPEWLSKANLKARVIVFIDEKGFLKKKQLILSSGNSAYDNLVMKSIDDSIPMPPPPEKFVDLVGVGGIEFAFPE